MIILSDASYTVFPSMENHGIESGKNKPLKEKWKTFGKRRGVVRGGQFSPLWALHLTVQVKLQGRTLYQKKLQGTEEKNKPLRLGPVSLVKPSYGAEMEEHNLFRCLLGNLILLSDYKMCRNL